MDDFVVLLVPATLEPADRVPDIVTQGDVVGQDQDLAPMTSVGIDRALREYGGLAATAAPLTLAKPGLLAVSASCFASKRLADPLVVACERVGAICA